MRLNSDVINQIMERTSEIEVVFSLTCRDTQIGQIVKITGNCEELGQWDPTRGLNLTTNVNEFPKWKGSAILARQGTGETLEYKYVIVRQSDSLPVLWEPFDGNRVATLKATAKLNIEDQFGQKQHIREEELPTKHISADKGPSKRTPLHQKIHTQPLEDSSDSSTLEKDTPAQAGHKTTVKEVTNILDKFNSLKRNADRPHLPQRNDGGRPSLGSNNHHHHHHQAHVLEAERQAEKLKMKRKLSGEAHKEEETKLIHSLCEFEQHHKGHRVQRDSQVSGLENLHFENLTPEQQPQVSMKLFDMPMPSNVPQLQSETQFVATGRHSMPGGPLTGFGGGTTGGVISSGEDEDEEDVDDEEDDMIGEDKRLLEDVKLTVEDIVIVASFKLPISVYREQGVWKVRSSKSMLYPTMFKLREKKKMVKILCIGWPGVVPSNEREAQDITDLLRGYGCVPIFFEADVLEQFFYFHETVLRPLFHNFKGLNDFEYDLGRQEYWSVYQYVNNKFAQSILEHKQDKEMIWIHDNYLLLLPTYLRRRDLNANMGFFMHCPFPSSDIFKMFPYRGEVLRSLILCDLIGFHLFEYARNFYTTCRRILGLNHEFKKGGFLSIECYGRNVMLRISHIGIQEEDIAAALETDTYKQFAKQLTQMISTHQGRRQVITSIDRFHPISGLKNKLLAYQKFLRDFPPFRTQTCLVQYVVPNEGTGYQQIKSELVQTRKEILDIVKEIEEEFGKSAIHYCEQDLLMEQRIALWAVSNILLITTLRDGQCLPPLEFITVKKLLSRSSKAAVILSEFSGCSRALGGVLKINPFNVDEIAKNIDIAINMPPEEREQRLKIAQNYVDKHSTYRWAEAFLKDLKRAHQPCEADGTSSGAQVATAGGGMTASSQLQHKFMLMGFGLNQRLIKTRLGFQELRLSYEEQNYQRAINRLIIIDQDGVLPMKGSHGLARNNVEPCANVLKILKDLSQDERNTVFIVSSATKEVVHKWYAQACPNLGLAAENGFFWRLDSIEKNENHWVKLLKITDFCWIESVKDIMQSYTEKTDGTFIEEKESMIAWNYQDTDPEFGNWQANELTSHLEHVFCNLPIEIVHVKKSLEVVPSQLKKLKLVKLLVKSIAKRFPIDFIMFIGNDHQGNEPVFSYLNNKKQQSSKLLTGNATVYTCTMGQRAAQAKYFLSESEQVVRLLEQLQAFSIQQRKNKSQNDLRLKNMESAGVLRSGTSIEFGQQMLGSSFRKGSGTIFERGGSRLSAGPNNHHSSDHLRQQLQHTASLLADTPKAGGDDIRQEDRTKDSQRVGSGLLLQTRDVREKIDREDDLEDQQSAEDNVSLGSGNSGSLLELQQQLSGGRRPSRKNKKR